MYDLNRRLGRIAGAIEATHKDEAHVVIAHSAAGTTRAADVLREEGFKVWSILFGDDVLAIKSALLNWRGSVGPAVLVIYAEVVPKLLGAGCKISHMQTINYHLVTNPLTISERRLDHVKILAADATRSSAFTGFTDNHSMVLLDWVNNHKPDLEDLRAKYSPDEDDEDDEEDEDGGPGPAPKAKAPKAPSRSRIDYFDSHQRMEGGLRSLTRAHKLGVLARLKLVTTVNRTAILATDSRMTGEWFAKELGTLGIDAVFISGLNTPETRDRKVLEWRTGEADILIIHTRLLPGLDLSGPGKLVEVHSAHPMSAGPANAFFIQVQKGNHDVQNWVWRRPGSRPIYGINEVYATPLLCSVPDAMTELEAKLGDKARELSRSVAAQVSLGNEISSLKRLNEALDGRLRDAATERDEYKAEVLKLRAQLALGGIEQPSTVMRRHADGADRVAMSGHQFNNLMNYAESLEKVVNLVKDHPEVKDQISDAFDKGARCVEDSKAEF